jgi:lipoprotein-anchoring transpeptidase ErfK/SrfK
MCRDAHPTGVESLTAKVTNTGPAVMSKRTALLALAAALTVVSTAVSASTREVVRYTAEVQPGTIVVKTAERKLYYVLGDGTAIRYAVAVGKPGKQWQGKARVSGKYVRPAWTPPAEVKADNPGLPEVIPGAAPNNPMGVAAMTLSGGEYAIHGTNKPESRLASSPRTAASGC